MDVATLGITVDADGAVRALRAFGDEAERTSKRTSGLERVAKELRSGLAILGGSFGAGLFLRKIINETAEAESALAQLEAAFRSTGGAAGYSVRQLDELSKSFAKISTFSDSAIKGGLTRLLTYTAIQGPMFKQATQAALDMAAALGTDVATAAERVGNALNYPSQALGSLSRQGFRFTEDQKRLIKQFEQTGQIAKAQAIIMGELEIAYGGRAAAGANTLGGALDRLGHAWGNLFEVSTDASKGIVGAINSIVENLPNIRSKFDTFFDGLISGFKGVKVGYLRDAQDIQKVLAFGNEVSGKLLSQFSGAVGQAGERMLAQAKEQRRFVQEVQKDIDRTIGLFDKNRANDPLAERGEIAGAAELPGRGPAGVETPGFTDETRKRIAAMQGELDKLTALNAAYQESSSALKILEIQQDAAAQKAKDSVEHYGRVRTALNGLTDAIAAQKIEAVKLAEARKQQQANTLADVSVAGQKNIAAAYRDSSVAAGVFAERQAALNQQIAQETQDLDPVNAKLAENRVRRLDAASAAVEQARQLRSVRDAGEDQLRSAQQAAAAQLLVGRAVQEAAIEWEYQNKVIQANRDLQPEVAAAAISAAEQVREAQLATLKVAREKAPIKNALVGAQEAFGDFFSGLVTRGSDAWRQLAQNIRQIYGNLLDEIAKRAFEAKILPKLAKVFGLDAEAAGTRMQSAAAQQVTAGSVMQTAAVQVVQGGSIMAVAASQMLLAARIMRGGGGQTDFSDVTGGTSSTTVTPPQPPPSGTVPPVAQPTTAAKILGGATIALAGFGVGQSVGGLTTSRPLGALGGAASGAATGAILGSILPGIGTAAGAVIGGVTGLIGGLLGSGRAAKQAAEELKRQQAAQLDLSATMEILRVRIAGGNTTLLEAVEANRRYFEQLKLQINEALPGRRNEEQRNLLRAEADQLRAREEQNIRADYERQQKERREDLEVRRLRAEGNNKEADALKLALEQQREYAQAVKDGADAAYLATLVQVQAMEKQKQAMDALTTAVRNAPSGFKVESYINRFATPRPAPFAPPPVNPLAPVLPVPNPIPQQLTAPTPAPVPSTVVNNYSATEREIQKTTETIREVQAAEKQQPLTSLVIAEARVQNLFVENAPKTEAATTLKPAFDSSGDALSDLRRAMLTFAQPKVVNNFTNTEREIQRTTETIKEVQAAQNTQDEQKIVSLAIEEARIGRLIVAATPDAPRTEPPRLAPLSLPPLQPLAPRLTSPTAYPKTTNVYLTFQPGSLDHAFQIDGNETPTQIASKVKKGLLQVAATTIGPNAPIEEAWTYVTTD